MRSEAKDLDLLSEAAIERALEAARGRAKDAESARAELDRTIAAAREEERLLRQILALRQGRTDIKAFGITALDEGPASPPAVHRGSKPPAVQASVDELATSGRPLHISELMRLLKERNVPIPGAGEQANLIAHLRRDHRIVRTSRGMYGLAAWGLTGAEPPRRKRRRYRKIRATAAKE